MFQSREFLQVVEIKGAPNGAASALGSGMSRLPPALVLLLLVLGFPVSGAARNEVTRPIDGSDCAKPTGALAVLASVGELLGLAKGCLPADDRGRSAAEAVEWDHIKDVYSKWEVQQCKDKRCVSNAFAAWVDIKDGAFWNDYEKLAPLMAGCFVWANIGSSRLSSEQIRYWTVQPVVYGKDTWMPGDNIHQVLQVKNTRTGEIHILDGWTAAARARSAIKFGSKAKATDIDTADSIRTHDELVGEWGEPSKTEPCTSSMEWLCDPSKCDTTGKVLR